MQKYTVLSQENVFHCVYLAKMLTSFICKILLASFLARIYSISLDIEIYTKLCCFFSSLLHGRILLLGEVDLLAWAGAAIDHDLHHILQLASGGCRRGIA